MKKLAKRFFGVLMKLAYGTPLKHRILSACSNWTKETRYLYRITRSVFFSTIYHRLPVWERLQVQELLMGRDAGRNWAEYYFKGGADTNKKEFSSYPPPHDSGAKIGRLLFHEAVPLFSYIDEALKKQKPPLVIQIGSSSGRDIAYFAKNFPSLDCIGTDIYSEVCQFASTQWNYKNLHFVPCAAHDTWLLTAGCPGKPNTLFFAQGSLQYVYPEYLDLFFKNVSKFVSGATVVLCEPGYEINGSPDTLRGSAPLGGFSYNHDYTYYASKNHFDIVVSRIIRPYIPYSAYPIRKGTVHYFMVAKNRG